MKAITTFSMALLATLAAHASIGSGLSEIDTNTNSGNGNTTYPKYANEEMILSPTAYFVSDYARPAADIASDNGKTIDAQSEPPQPLYFEVSASEIRQDQRMTEAQTAQYAPLDFKYVNRGTAKPIPGALPKL